MSLVALLAAVLGWGRTPGAGAQAFAQEAPSVERAVAVTVTTSSGAAIAGATVTVREIPSDLSIPSAREALACEPTGRTATDSSGVARLAAGDAGAWFLQVSAPGRAAWTRLIHPPDGLSALSAELPDGASIGGVVTEEGDAPVTDAVVYAGPIGFESDPAAILAFSRTSSDGRYALEGLPFGAVDVFAERPGSGPRFVARVEVPGVADVPISIPRGATMSGVVREQDTDRPVPGVAVRLTALNGGFGAQGVSDASGRYEIVSYAGFVMFEGLEIVSDTWEFVRSTGEQNAGHFNAARPGRRDVLVKRRKPAADATGTPAPPRIAGTVTDLSGRGLADLLVVCDATDSWSVTDSSGAFEVAYVEEPSWDVRVRSADHSTARRNVDGDGRLGIALRAAPVVRIRTVDAEGRPVPGAHVTIGDVDAYQRRSWFRTSEQPAVPLYGFTGRSGTVAISRRRVGDLTVGVVARGFVATRQSMPVPEDGTDLSIVLEADAPTTVRVVSSDDGQPIAGAWVWARARETLQVGHAQVAGYRGYPWSARTGAAGSVELRGLVAGETTVEVAAPAHFSATVSAKFPTEGGLTLPLAPHRSISGRFVRPDGSPATAGKYQYICVDDPEDWGGWFWMDETGRFDIGGLHDRAYWITVGTSSGAGAAPAVYGPLDAGTTDHRLVVHEARTVRGRLLGADGEPIAGAHVEVAPSADFVQMTLASAETDADGRFTAEGCAIGPLHVRASVSGWRGIESAQRAETWHGVDAPAEDAELELTFPTGLDISGRLVRRETREPMTEVWLAAIPADVRSLGMFFDSSWVNIGVTDAEGRFRIEGLAEGLYRIWIPPPARGSGPPVKRLPVDPDPGTRAGTTDVECSWEYVSDED